jgi:PAS domain S-box-containing protein
MAGATTGIRFIVVTMTASSSESIRKWNFLLWQRMVLFSFTYFAIAQLSAHLSAPDWNFVGFWMPAGFSIAVLLLSRTRDWPWLLLAILPANLLFDILQGTKVPVIFGFYCANVVEYASGAWLVRTFVAERPELKTLKEVTGLIALGAIFNSMAGAAVAAATLVLFGVSHSFVISWQTWWGSNVMAILVVTPFILAWVRPLNGVLHVFILPKKIVEAVLLLVGLSVSLWCLLISDQGVMSPNRIFAIPFLLWSGLRFGTRGATATCLIMALVLSFFSVKAFPPVAQGPASLGAYLFIVQAVLGMATLIALIPAIVLAERDRTMAKLRESEDHYRSLTQAAFEGVAISENGRLLDVNDEILNMLGYEREEMIGRKIVEMTAPECRDVIAERIRDHAGDILEHRLVRKDGTFIIVEARAKSARMGERTVRMTALRDITERKKIEQER